MIVQLGWKAGPRNARVWGLAKSWKREVDIGTMVAHDEDAITLLTVCWGLAKAHFPSDAIGHIENCFSESGLPNITTRNVSEGWLFTPGTSITKSGVGDGYHLEINREVFQFLSVSHAPPEGYFSQITWRRSTLIIWSKATSLSH